MFYSSTGSMQVINNSKTYTIGEHQMLIYKPSGNQDITSYHNGSYVHAIFSGISVTEILQSLDLSCDIIYDIEPLYAAGGDGFLFFNKQIEYVTSEFRKKNKHYDISSTCMFIEFLTLCARNISTTQNDKNIQCIKNAILYISHHTGSEINIDTLLEKVHFSRSCFYKLFKKYTGTTPIQFHNSLRLSCAADYLIIYDYSVSEVSKILGYNDPLYFSRLFKKQYGMSPTEYVKMYKNYKAIENDNDFLIVQNEL